MTEHVARLQDAITDEGQRRAALLLRTLPALLIPAAAALGMFVVLRLTQGEPPPPAPGMPAPPGAPPSALPMLLGQFALPLLLSAALLLLVRAGRTTAPALVLVGTWTLIYTLGALSSGVMSFWPASLVVPICAAALLLSSRAGMGIAALATLLVAGSAWLEIQGLRVPWDLGPLFGGPGRPPPPPAMVPPPPGLPFPPQPPPGLPLLAIGYWVGLFWTVAVLTSLLAGSLQRALQQSRAHAHALSQLSAELEDRVAAQTAELLHQEREAATLEERARLARDIHDALAQNLTGIIVQLGAVQRARSVAPGEVDEHLDLAQRMARESLAEARRSVWNLRAPALARGDLGDALRGLVARPVSPEATARFAQVGEPWPLPPAVEAALLRVCQEALANVAKHARATAVAVTLEYSATAVRLAVRDNGVGFDAAALRERPSHAAPWRGFGLLGMRERLAALGGTLILKSDGGAEVVAAVPRPDTAREMTRVPGTGLPTTASTTAAEDEPTPTPAAAGRRP
ncbi:MAG TPA: sensor histidine kinase [Chloroflexota bacterium]|nr:sensor histidine kinase [Chloroflexota bacterium]